MSAVVDDEEVDPPFLNIDFGQKVTPNKKVNFRKTGNWGRVKTHFRPFGQIVPKLTIARFFRFFNQDPFLLPSTKWPPTVIKDIACLFYPLQNQTTN
jgi:hypothetical protein